MSGWAPPDPADPHRTWIYTPHSALDNGLHGLMLVLHGCSQTNDELKQFGNLEKSAEANGLVLAVPYVGMRNFGAFCWDYDGAADRSRNVRDLIALTRNLESRGPLRIDASQVYVVGLSSGAAPALSLLLACQAPDLFAGIGAVAGPSVGSNQWSAFAHATQIPSTNVDDAVRACRSLAGDKAGFFATQVANIAYGDMDENGPNAKFEHSGETDHPGQYSVVSIQWSLDNVRVLREIYGTGDLGPQVPVQDGKGIERIAEALGAARVSLLVVHDVGHAWPAGTGQPNRVQAGGLWIAQQGLDYPAYVTRWFIDNNRRSNRRAK
jgi:poly(3-hydroxybutyrate) depolymerase